MTASELKAPFPWFGGKRRVASIVWAALGNPDSYVEPFAGSLAVLLARPADQVAGAVETVNDADAYLENFWRALAADPDAVAAACDWPVNETALIARHLWLVNEGRRRIASMESDPDFFDAKVAGWWVWGINSWIGAGWCKGDGPWHAINGEVVKLDRSDRPDPPDSGVNRQLPHLGDAGRGVNRKRPDLSNRRPGPELNKCWTGDTPLIEYFHALSARLRRVRVCCGDWARVLTEGATAYGDSVGLFLDPPYLGDVRTRDLYRIDDHSLSIAVRDWAIARGRDPRFRIVLAGYHAEHADAMPPDWREMRYAANASYQTADRAAAGTGGNMDRRHNESLWFSPACSGGAFALGAATACPLFPDPEPSNA